MNTVPRTSLEPQQDARIDVASLLRMLFDHKALIVSVVGVFTLLGAGYALVATPVYQANAMIQIEPKKIGLDATPVFNSKPTSVSEAATEIELIKSRAVLGRVITDLHLDVTATPRYVPLLGKWYARQFAPAKGQLASAPLGLDQFAWGGEAITVGALDVPPSLLGLPMVLTAGDNGGYSLKDANGTELLSGTVGVASENNGVSLLLTQLNARPGTEFRVVRNRELATALDYQERLKVNEAGKDSGIVYLSIQDTDPARAVQLVKEVSDRYVRQNVERSSAEAGQRLDFLRSQLPVVRAELEKSENALHTFQLRTHAVDIGQQTSALLSQVVAYDNQLSELRLKRTDLDRLYTRQHPQSIALSQQIAQVEAQKAKLQGEVSQLPETQQDLLRLTRDMQVTTQTYTNLLNRVQEQDIIRAGNIGNVRIIDSADANVEEPVKPMRKLIVALAALLGALAAISTVFVRQAFYRGVENPESVEQLGLPVYAALPLSRQQERLNRGQTRKGQAPSRLLGVVAPREGTMEALRSLRTSLHFAMAEARNPVLMMTSPTPGVGKSFVCTNLAVVSAQAGKRVLLIDADMRKGYLHQQFGVQPRHGLADALAGKVTVADVVHDTPVKHLQIISCGYAAPNPSELLMHERFTQLLNELSPHYDLVIIDTPPVLAVTDASLIGRHAGTSMMVSRFGQSTVREIDVARRRLQQNGVNLKGAIFNGVVRKASTAEYDCASYGYDYGDARK
ncbi:MULTISPECIES: polysaccharide biosynthesis tyrosine autokinase [Pseudomonas]|uniref:Polysaccharide biosynthesis tyrosine autokinase n=1 Tax=Pseudomonas quercus TaxID=2722792 RepID=A0ABX0YLM0_9PSED|nr:MULTISPECIES: polysaccharide biosynthesis tyrosine autokinase [Pseudomonas]MBF7144288.1 polysaccharide biosynthesis tyrosine autokinase [Pseudomonas sp. LY10J]NJP02828.1 polysaccharide biosynthesis tyrosine autokinase [Pseudomonas quercus]